MVIFRVSQTRDRFGTVLNIDGKLVGDYVGVAEDCCSQALSGGRSVSVFLRDVSVIDAAGRGLLYRLAGLGVQLMASGVYMSHLVENLQCGGTTQGSTGSAQGEATRDHDR